MNNKEEKQKSFNRLINEKSPYLLQHAENPVDWYPWSEEAFKSAKEQDKPIFLSIGYATCHWCHVMAHESFEDEDVARILNQYYVSIKVDREERPDIDHIYMNVCQALTGRGGWPLSIFMTPEGKPFYAGTYFPKESRMGMTGFMDILRQIASLWWKDRNRLLDVSDKIIDAIQTKTDQATGVTNLDSDVLKKGYEQLARSFDPRWGGFGREPKFPSPHQLTFLMRWNLRSKNSSALEMSEKTLDNMRSGGIFDQIGFGFHRYSVDERWLVPHFEKMLYDQALLAIAYIEAYQIAQNESYAATAQEIFQYVLRDMTSPEGGFYSAEDADSEGKEGMFYIWTPEEVKIHLGEERGDIFCRFYDIRDGGNFEDGYSIPHMPVSVETFAKKEGMDVTELKEILEESRIQLFSVREKRVHPLKDDKIITAWNGLMIAALAKGYKALGDETYKDAAKDAVSFILNTLKKDENRLLRRYRQGHVAYHAYLDDYAFLVWGLIELYEATFEISYLEEAIHINRTMIDLFWDEAEGVFYFTGKENESLITRSKEIYDGAMPSGNSVAALNLLRLGRMTGDTVLEKKIDRMGAAFTADIFTHPMAHTHFLGAVDFMVGPSMEIVIAGDPDLTESKEMAKTINRMFLPNKVLLFRPQGEEGKRVSTVSPFASDLAPTNEKPTVFICEQYTCKRPITDIVELERTLTK
ncbi:MAG: thioredoxin domain-containing protein [Thermodesulfobacteriota bacterium]|nr:thioredoxin domain-containing protein [Thermodesulfobacteriota bacterium]